MERKKILILTAVQIETNALRQTAGQFGCDLHTVGIGAGHLPSADRLSQASCIIMCGLAGGLNPDLKVGDVVLQDNNYFPVSTQRGTIFSSTALISTPQEKAQLFARTGAWVVDMEQAIVQQYARSFNIPVFGLRAISDSASQTLDPRIVHFVDDLGKPRLLKIAAGLLRSPALFLYLLRLNTNTKYALLQLTRTLKAILTSIENESPR